MRIRTAYDCEIEPRDLANLQSGHRLSATLSDGSVAFTFRMDPALLVQPNGPSRVKSVVTHEPKLLTEGTPSKKKVGVSGTCPYCHQGPYVNVLGHIRHQHPDKPIHAAGKFHCTQCSQRYSTNQGLSLHMRFSHKVKGKDAKKKPAPAES